MTTIVRAIKVAGEGKWEHQQIPQVAEVDRLLNSGFDVKASHLMTVGDGAFIMIVLFRADDKRNASNDNAPTAENIT